MHKSGITVLGFTLRFTFDFAAGLHNVYLLDQGFLSSATPKNTKATALKQNERVAARKETLKGKTLSRNAFPLGFEAEVLIDHLKYPSNPKTPLRKDLFGKIRSLVLQETPPPPSERETIPLGGWLGHLLVTPSSHHAVQKTNELVEILEVRKLLRLNNNKPEKSVKKYLGISFVL